MAETTPRLEGVEKEAKHLSSNYWRRPHAGTTSNALELTISHEFNRNKPSKGAETTLTFEHPWPDARKTKAPFSFRTSQRLHK